MSEEETASILQQANDCAEGECSIDDVSELVYELKEQEKEMKQRLDKVKKMITDLEDINAKEERKTDDVRNLVRDMLRVFDYKDNGHPIGFSGDIGDGPTTAYVCE